METTARPESVHQLPDPALDGADCEAKLGRDRLVLHPSSKEQEDACIHRLESPFVGFVEPDYPITNFMSDSSADVSARTTDANGVYSFDPAAGPMGGLVSNVEGLSAEEVTGAGVTVAVTDSGIDNTHRDFGGWNCEAGPYQPCDSRIVHAAATEHLVGFETSDALPTTDLFSGHGTHVAGTIVGNGYYTRDGDTDPRYGGDSHVIGIAPNASLISVKNGDSASAAFAAEALRRFNDAVLKAVYV